MTRVCLLTVFYSVVQILETFSIPVHSPFYKLIGPAIMVLGFKGGNHLVLVNTLTFETVYQIHIAPANNPGNFSYSRTPTRVCFDEDLNVLVIASESRASLCTVAITPPVSFFGNNSEKRHGLSFVDLLSNRRNFDTFETFHLGTHTNPYPYF